MFRHHTQFQDLSEPITSHPVYLKLRDIHHHQHSVYQHSLAVAWLSFRIGKLLRFKLSELVRGALLHDFFLYDWRKERPSSGKLHGFEHPKVALANSTRYFSPLTPVEKDIILRHMWPLTLRPPKYKESMLVSITDKIVATREVTVEFFRKWKKRL